MSGFRNVADVPAASVAGLEVGNLLGSGRISNIIDTQTGPHEIKKPHTRVGRAVDIIEMQCRRARIR